MSFSRDTYFQRQTIMSEFGEEAQEKLEQAKVLVVGCGGLGSPAAIYLATSGIGALHLVDFDTVSISNLHRQVFYDLEDVGKSKVAVLAAKIQKKAPFCAVTFSSKPLSKDNAKFLIEAYDVVVDGTDHLPTKYLINDVCVLLGKPLVYGSLYKFDGYAASFNLKEENGCYSCNLRDAFPEISTDVPNCEEAGTLNPIVGMIALLQVNEVLKIITGIGAPIKNQLLIFNSLKNTLFKMKLKSTLRNYKTLFQSTSYDHVLCSAQKKEWLISNKALKTKESDLNIINLTNKKEVDIPFEKYRTISVRDFKVDTFEFSSEKTYVFVCNKGISSYRIVENIKQQFPEINAYSLAGGLENY